MIDQLQSVESPRPPRPTLQKVIKLKEGTSKGDPSQGKRRNSDNKKVHEGALAPPLTPPTKGATSSLSKWLMRRATPTKPMRNASHDESHTSWSTLETAELTARTNSFSQFDESPSSSSRNVCSIDTSHASTLSDFMKSSMSEVKEEEEEERHDKATSPKSIKMKAKPQISWSGYNGNTSRVSGSESSASSKSKNSLAYIPNDSLLQVPDLMMNDDEKDEGTTSSSSNSSNARRDPSSLSFSSSSASSPTSSSSKRKSGFRYPSMLTTNDIDDNNNTKIQKEIRLFDKLKNGHDSISMNSNNKKSSITSTCSSACSSISMDSRLHSMDSQATTSQHDHYRTILSENEFVATCQKSHGTCIMHVYDYSIDYSDLSCAIDKHLERMSAPLYNDRRSMAQKCEFVRVHSSLLSPELSNKLGVTIPTSSSPSSSACKMAPTVLAIRNGVVEGQLSDLYPDLYKNDGTTKCNFPSADELEDGQFIKDFVLITGCTKSDSCNLRSLLNSFRFVSITERGGGIL